MCDVDVCRLRKHLCGCCYWMVPHPHTGRYALVMEHTLYMMELVFAISSMITSAHAIEVAGSASDDSSRLVPSGPCAPWIVCSQIGTQSVLTGNTWPRRAACERSMHRHTARPSRILSWQTPPCLPAPAMCHLQDRAHKAATYKPPPASLQPPDPTGGAAHAQLPQPQPGTPPYPALTSHRVCGALAAGLERLAAEFRCCVVAARHATLQQVRAEGVLQR